MLCERKRRDGPGGVLQLLTEYGVELIVKRRRQGVEAGGGDGPSFI